MDRFRPRRGPPGDDALRAARQRTNARGAATRVSPRSRRRCGRRPLDDAALSDMAKDTAFKPTVANLQGYADAVRQKSLAV